MTWDFDLYRNPLAAARDAYAHQAVLSVREAKRAFDEIRRWPGYAPTPLRELSVAASEAGVRRVAYKDEGARFDLKSFKALGGAYAVGRILQDIAGGRPVTMDDLVTGTHALVTRGVTVACASDGNHGRSVAWGAKLFGCACTIFLHEGVSPGREAAIRAYGAEVIRTPGDYDDSVREAVATSRACGWRVVADTSEDPDDPVPALVMQGYAGLVIEAMEQLGEVPSHVFLQGGVGGLAAAVVAQMWETLGPERAPVFVVVEPRRADCLYRSAVAGRPTRATGDLETVMAGLSCGEVSRVAWPILSEAVAFFQTIDDEAAVACMRLLHRGELGGRPIEGGESGVAGLAGLLALTRGGGEAALRELGLGPASSVLLIGTEGATDPAIYRALVA